MTDTGNTFLLAIESGVAGGSVAVAINGNAVDCWIGPTNSSRAEDLLAAIDEICTRSIGGIASINKVAVSLGPGSYTGLRIGVATALGLAKGIGVECAGVPMLEALVALARDGDDAISAVPMGRTDICYQHFDPAKLNRSEASSISRQGFEEILTALPDAHLVVPESLKNLRSERVTNAGNCLAQHIASFATAMQFSHGTNPVYVQNPRLF